MTVKTVRFRDVDSAASAKYAITHAIGDFERLRGAIGDDMAATKALYQGMIEGFRVALADLDAGTYEVSNG